MAGGSDVLAQGGHETGSSPKRPAEAALADSSKRSRASPIPVSDSEGSDSDVICLDSDDEDERYDALLVEDEEPAQQPRSEVAQSKVAAPPAIPWKGLNGAKRLMAEFQALQSEILKGNGQASCGPAKIHDLQFHQDQIDCWRLKLSQFDDESAEGRQLNKDLAALESKGIGSGCVLVEIRFPQNYPTNPFFLRIVSPRMKMYTGHITAGGSVCIQALTTGTSDSNWQSSFSVEGILTLVCTNMLDSERMQVRTATGPGGMSGPARVEFRLAHAEYSEHEAQAAFQRMEQHHRVNGW
mmetsp:Transcript_27114/g.55232  ORF Transcript_27114/g.55232 Transcript_27114/m.55232 type:complete len:297 (-) Transcript_27114:766-1656(-)